MDPNRHLLKRRKNPTSKAPAPTNKILVLADVGGHYFTERQQRRVWNQGPLPYGMRSHHYTESTKKNDATYGRDGIHDHVMRRNQQIDQDGAAKETTRSRIRTATPRIRREPRGQTQTNSARPDIAEKVRVPNHPKQGIQYSIFPVYEFPGNAPRLPVY